MTTQNVYRAQNALTYTFNDVEMLRLALTAAGADADNYDGNRKLAQLGDALIGSVLVDNAFSMGVPRSTTSEILQAIATKEHRAVTAKRLGIDTCVLCSPRQQNQEPSIVVLSNAISAIVGAVWCDSGKDFEVLRGAVMDFGVTIQESPHTTPDASLHENFPPADNVGSSLPSTDWQNIPSSATLSQRSQDSLDFREENGPQLYSGAWDYTLAESLAPIWPTLSFSNLGFNETEGLPGALIDFDNLHQTISMGVDTTEPWSISGLHFNAPDLQVTGDTQFSQLVVVEGQNLHDAAPETISRKRKLPDEEKSLKIGDSAMLDLYILLEKKRCEAHSLPCPEKAFDLAMKSTLLFRNKAENYVAKLFFFGIGSSESIAVLQGILQAHRCNENAEPIKANCFLSMSERLKEIDRLNGAASYFNFLRRCNVHQLYIECSASNRKSSDDFVINTAQSIVERKEKRIGNPCNLGDSDVSKSIMAEVYPLLEEETEEYKRKYRSVSTLRKLGQRLDQLIFKFGYGILGLFPATCSSTELTLYISDAMILFLKNPQFKELIRILHASQGDTLRQYSKAVESVVKQVFEGAPLSSTSIAIDSLERDQILKQPKGSPELLQLLSKPT